MFPDGKDAVFEVSIDTETLEVRPDESEPPDWARLDFHKCPHCPLEESEHPLCPLAASIARVVSRFENILSYETVDIEVHTEERTVSAETTAQQGLSSLLGLIMAPSGCPHTVYFKPMARFHLPLSTEGETVYRAASMYLLSQYFTTRAGAPIDSGLDGLRAIYDKIQELNRAMAQRVREAITQDAAVNAIVVLDFFAQTLPFVIEDHLDDLRPLFKGYLNDSNEKEG